MNAITTSQDKLEFRSARTRSLLRSIWGWITRTDTKLYAWDELRARLKPQALVNRGIQTVDSDKIVGSVGRFHDFDNAFLPRNRHLTERWSSINNAYHSDVPLPPIKLYKVGEVYFVIDGNHRVSVAREHGQTYIDAEVTEAILRVPVTEKDIDSVNLEVLGEYQQFLEHTRLDKLRPNADVRFSVPRCYNDLLEHIETHKYYMGIEQKHDIVYEAAVVDWYDKVYLPLVEVIRAEDVLESFPGRTVADLYLWVIEHRHYLQQMHEAELEGDQFPMQAAAQDFAENYAPRTSLQKVHDVIGSALEGITGR